MAKGLYRTANGWVHVDYGDHTIPVIKSKYKKSGYQPDYDKLPSAATYRAAEREKHRDFQD